jgi:hypothetical protein
LSATARAHRGGGFGGIIWTPRPAKPISPYAQERGFEFGLLLELGTIAAESWWDRRSAAQDGDHDDDEPLTMLIAVTRWFCSIELPDDPLSIANGPPLFERRRSSQSEAEAG